MTFGQWRPVGALINSEVTKVLPYPELLAKIELLTCSKPYQGRFRHAISLLNIIIAVEKGSMSRYRQFNLG